MCRKNKSSERFGMLPVIFGLALPTMLEQLMQTAVQYIDIAMVGSLGTAATAAVGSTTTINWLISSTISALGIGFLTFIARAYGADDKETAAKVSSQAVFVTLVVGIFFTILTALLSSYVPVWMQVEPEIRSLASTYFLIIYLPMLPRSATIIFGTALRAAGDTKTPMRVGIAVNLINVCLNLTLIPIFGVIGAAIASAIGFTVGGILMTVCFFRHPVISPKGQRLLPDMDILKPCLKVAFPNMLQRFGTSLGYVFFAAMINSLGDVATAAHTVANTVESAFYIPGYGMQTAAATLAGNAYGAGDKKQMKSLGRTILWIEVLLMIISGGLLFAFAPVMVSIFAKDPAVIVLGSTVLRMVALSEPFYGVGIIIEGILQGVGKTDVPLFFNILGMWGIRIVGTYICITQLNMGLVSAWACMIAHNMLLFLMFVIYYKSNKWNPLYNAKNGTH